MEKSLRRLHRALRILLLQSMTEIVEDHQRAAGNVAVEAFGILGWNKAITPTRQDESGQSQLLDTFEKRTGASLPVGQVRLAPVSWGNR
jgi:hypothetical protein